MIEVHEALAALRTLAGADVLRPSGFSKREGDIARLIAPLPDASRRPDRTAKRTNDMSDILENPIGLDGFEFVEFSAPEKGLLEPIFTAMGFTRIARHRSKDVQLWRQGGINLITNYEPRSPAAYFAAEHGPSACGMGWRVHDAAKAYAEVIERGAEPVEVQTGPMELRLPAIRGIGGSIIYLLDRYGEKLSIYDIDFVYEHGVDRNPAGAGLKVIDHLTHNV
jgi:4-hydroxyphenylpyruvate dioxygenase